MNLGLSLFVLSLSIGCGKDQKAMATGSPTGTGGESNSKTELSDSYELSFNGCSTGKHEFKASSESELLDQVCNALNDDKLNKSCAESMRRAEFKRRCEPSGKKWKEAEQAEAKPLMKGSYQVVTSECTTGYHEFLASTESEMLDHYCDALKDEELNDHCGKKERLTLFREKCEPLGKTWEQN